MVSCGQQQPWDGVGDLCEGLKPGGRESSKKNLACGDLPPSRASLRRLNAFLR